MLILRIARGVGDHFPSRASEWALAVVLINWGRIILLPQDTFAGPSYGLLAWAFPEWAWGLACVLIGSARVLALVINGTFKDTTYSRYSPHVRSAMAALTALFWAAIALSFWAGNALGTGAGTYTIIFALDAYNAYRSAKDARQSDDGARHGRK